MKIKQTPLLLSLALFAFYFPAIGYAQPQAGDRTFILSGTGSSHDAFDHTVAAVSADFGKFLSDVTEVGIKQSVGFTDSPANTALSGATFLFAHRYFDNGAWQPFIGASMGVPYGEFVDESFYIGPEIGARYYVMHHTFITGRIGYLINVEEDPGDGLVEYTLGIGFDF